MNIRRHIDISGIVQGVGFRPYIYRLATERQLAGTILNTAAGVAVEVEGAPEAVADFFSRIQPDAPPLAHITEIAARDVPCLGAVEFCILATQPGEAVRTLISPDVATCEDCRRELLHPTNRRYRYPFINCTNCGPRFTITRNIPYDRPSTSMSVFPMCPACQAEYLDPRNRRFHAQPNACWECGPKLEIWDSTGLEIKGVDPIAHAILRLQAGHIVAVKGLGGFHLAADATNIKAICLLRDRKRRVEKPFAIMVKSLSQAEQLCQVSRAEAQVLLSIERPIVLLRRREPSIIPDQIAPFQRHLGVFLPYTPVHHLLFAEGGFQALIMTSGNLSEEPIAIDNHEARTRLRDLADYFLVHNREILLRCDDSVVRVARERSIPNFAPPLPSNLASEVLARGARRETLQYFPVIRHIRRSRGFVPVPVFLDREIPSVLAVGGQLKNTVCLTQRDQAFLSQHVGDLENLESYKFFGEAIDHLRRILEISPEILAHDLHPGYFCTHWSLQQKGFRRIGVQHHHAHVASCMAENQLAGDVIGIALDGTGYGTDGKTWGGEVLLANYKTFKRAAHFEYVPMPGGEAAVREPWRMALGYLAHHFGRELVTFKLPFLERLGLRNVELLLQMIDRQVNSPLTSSCGRLFDAVAALAEVRQSVNYEAQAAIELEMVINDSSPEEVYPFELLPADGAYIIGTRPLFAALLEDIAKQTPVGIISLRFHNGLVELFLGLAKKLRQQTNFDRICLSGGSFNNVYLAEHLGRRLKADGFQLFTHSQVPAGDGGLSLGQAMIAAHQAPRGAYPG